MPVRVLGILPAPAALPLVLYHGIGGSFSPGQVWSLFKKYKFLALPAGSQASIPQTPTGIVTDGASIGGMIVTGKHRGTGRTTCPNATLCSTDLSNTGLRLNQGLRFEKRATNRLSHETSEFIRDERKEPRLILKKQHRRETACRGWRALANRATKLRLR